jgi:hypothetical protein
MSGCGTKRTYGYSLAMSASEGRTDFPFKVTLGPTLGAIGCKLLLVEDAEATARIRARHSEQVRYKPHTLLGADAAPKALSERLVE